MRKVLYSIIIILLFASCENEIPFNEKDHPRKLIVNALFDADKDENNIFLSLTGKEYTEHWIIKNVSADIYLNGVLAEQIRKDETAYALRTSIRFKPGDVIRMEIKVNDGEYSTWTEDVVPQPISIDKIETTMVNKNPSSGESIWESYGSSLRVKTTFTDDHKKTNYYRIWMEYIFDVELKRPDPSEPIISHHIEMPLIVREDVVLTDGQPTTEDDDDNWIITPIENLFGVFDNSRINGSYTMTTSMMFPHYYLFTGDYGQVKRVVVKVKVRLSSISRMQYLYLRALNIYSSIDYDNFFNMPVKFPSNINGGTGIFGISAATETIVTIGEYIPDENNSPGGYG